MMRRSVDLPAPLAPRRATASPSRTSRATSDKAASEGFSKGCRNARQPLRAGGKDLLSDSMDMAARVTTDLIT